MSIATADRQQAFSPEKTLFVCVRDRHGKGASCAGSGSIAMLEQMRAMLAAEGLTEQDLHLQPCGCLGLCRQGPAAVVASGTAALTKKPPKAKQRKRGVYVRLKNRKLRQLLRAVFAEPVPQRG